MVKFHEPPYDLQKVAEHVDLSGLVRRKDIQAAAQEVVNNFEF
jgi:hypothetical protein